MNTMTWIFIAAGFAILILGILAIVYFSRKESSKKGEPEIYRGAQDPPKEHDSSNDYEEVEPPPPVVVEEEPEEYIEVEQEYEPQPQPEPTSFEQAYQPQSSGYTTIATSYEITQIKDEPVGELKFTFPARNESNEFSPTFVEQPPRDNREDYEEL